MVRIFLAAILAAFVIAIPSAGHAQEKDLQAQLAQCLGLGGAADRLSCYDGVARRAGSPAPLVQPRAAQEFGNEQLHPETPTDDQLVAEVADFQRDKQGRFTVTLRNGQVWRQVAGDTARAQAHSGGLVRISRGSLGSYDLRFDGRNATYTVQRLR